MEKKEAIAAVLYRYPEKRGLPVEEEELILKEGHGILGDCHAGRDDRQISLLSIQEKKWMKEQKIQGICFSRFRENLLLDGIEFCTLQPGDQLVCGETILELSEFIKKCFPEHCQLAAEGYFCPLAQSTRFAFVKKGGKIQKGCSIVLRKGTICSEKIAE